jgi:hypothetical protein
MKPHSESGNVSGRDKHNLSEVFFVAKALYSNQTRKLQAALVPVLTHSRIKIKCRTSVAQVLENEQMLAVVL